MTHIIYGSPNTVLTMGMALLGDVVTPFIGFIDGNRVDEFNDLISDNEPLALVDHIQVVNGTIVFFENPPAAMMLHASITQLFAFALDGAWGNKEKAVLQ